MTLLECCASQISHLSRVIGLLLEIEKFECMEKSEKKIYYFLLRIKGSEIKFRRFLGGEGAVVKRRLRNENVGRGSLKLISIFDRLKFILPRFEGNKYEYYPHS